MGVCQTSIEPGLLHLNEPQPINGSLLTGRNYKENRERPSQASSLPTGQSCEYQLGSRKCKYFGPIVNGVKQGQGQLFIEPEGDLWVCRFADDMPHGPGQIYFGNGDFFEGTLQRGQLHVGRYSYQNGMSMQGEWANERKNGYFEVVLADGNRVLGTFEQDQLLSDAIVMDSAGTCRPLTQAERDLFLGR